MMEEITRHSEAVFLNETLFDEKAEQGVELDYILPDYYPEIFRILKCCVTPRVTSAAVSGNKLEISGYAVIRVLYLAENSTALNCVEQRYTWSKSLNISPAKENCIGEPIVTVTPKTDYCSCRAVSSRRIDVRGAISFKISVCCTSKFMLPAMPDGMQVLKKLVPCCMQPIVSIRQLTVREEIDTGARGIDYIVSCDAFPTVTDVRIVANKAVVKGNVTVTALYGVHSENNSGVTELEKMTADIPISQIVDMPGLSESYNCRPELIVKTCELTPQADSGVVSCEIVLECRCKAYSPAEAEIPCDAYSTEYECTCTAVTLKIPECPKPINSRVSLKASMSLSSEPEIVWDCRSELYNTSCRIENDKIALTGQMLVQAVGKYSGGVPFFEEKTEAFETEVPFGQISAEDISADCSVCCMVNVCETGFSIRPDNSLDISVAAEVCGELCSSSQVTVLNSAALLKDSPKEKNSEFAVRICYTGEGESPWNIAKKYNTSVDAVMSENGIEDKNALLSGMVIIPSADN